jgi:replicative DNA helicase
LLAAALHRKEDYILIASRIPDDDEFWLLKQHAALWRFIITLYEGGVQIITEDLVKTATPELVAQIWSRTGTNIEYNLAQCADASTRRKLHTSAKKLSAAISNKTRATADIVTEHLAQVSIQVSPAMQSEFTAPQQVDLAMDYVHERMANGGEMPGITMGAKWKSLTSATLGFQDSYLYLLAASPKAGKTATTK